MRAAKLAVDTARGRVELAARRHELMDRGEVARVLAPAVRRLRDALMGVPREVIEDRALRRAVEVALAGALDGFCREALHKATEEAGA